jgi:hypothetical protein
MVARGTLNHRSRRKPLYRRLIKLILSGLRGWSHSHNWLPDFRIEANEAGPPARAIYRGRKVCDFGSSRLLCEVFKGSELFVIGSGPSVATACFDEVGPRSAILLNGACTLIGKRVQEPLAIAVEDERFIWRHFDLLREKTPAGTILLLSTGVIRAVCDIDADWLQRMRIILIDDIRKPYGKMQRSYGELRLVRGTRINEAEDAGFSIDPDIGVFQGGSVAISAIQFAAYCRPQIISLIGIDISNADQPRFYEREGQTAPSGIKRSQDRILRHVALAREVCETSGTRLRSLSPISLLNQLLRDGRSQRQIEEEQTLHEISRG